MFNRIADMPSNSNGARTVLEEHLDVNNALLASFLAALVRGTFEAGGVIDAGTITVESDGVTITVTGRSGITNDLRAAVVVQEQSVDCSGLANGNKARVYISAELGEHVQVNFTDADTGEALTHTLGVVLGKLQVIEGDAANYPALPPGSVPVAKISKAAGVVSVDAAEDDAPVVRGGGGGGGVEAFTDLSDTPSDYTGSGGKLVAVTAEADGLEFVDPPNAPDLTGLLPKLATLNSYAGNRTLDASDSGAYVRITAAGTVTLPDGLSTGFQCVIVNATDSDTVVLSAATTLTIPAGFEPEIQNRRAVTVIHVGSNVWEAHGALVEEEA